jgi:hypothetical protein
MKERSPEPKYPWRQELTIVQLQPQHSCKMAPSIVNWYELLNSLLFEV